MNIVNLQVKYLFVSRYIWECVA